MSKIYTVEDQEHFLKTLPELFETLSIEEISAIADRLGLSEVIDGGKLVPVYSVQIESSSEKFVDLKLIDNIKLKGQLYNYYTKVEGDTYTWTRESGLPNDRDWIKTLDGRLP